MKFALCMCCSLLVFGQSLEQTLLDKIAALEKRLAEVEGKLSKGATPAPPPAAIAPSAPAAGAATATAAPVHTVDETNAWLKDTTLNFGFDGYYLWNSNRPLGRTNLLRAYDTSANSMSIAQTGIILEHAPNPQEGKPWGYRLDLMYGQATEAGQGSPNNEPRPQVYRNIYQAYGQYVAPIGKGLTMDFGKWAGAFGPEGNYTKDQINYSRSYLFNMLPYYHMGLRAAYPLNDKVSMQYWLVNGAHSSEDFNGFKSQLFELTVKPTKSLSWTSNYYNGREQRDTFGPAPRGRLHVIDTYATWNATDKLAFTGVFDYVVSRVESTDPPQRAVGFAGYLRYQITPKAYFGQRYVRLTDHAGYFSGAAQKLNDTTSTLGYRPYDGFEARLEYRRDGSNVPFFLTRNAGVLARSQNTFTLGLLWWFGGKTGAW